MTRIKTLIAGTFILGALFIFGCATYQTKVSSARGDLYNRRFKEAAEKLKPLAEQAGKDQLVYLFDYGTALQLAGDYKKSTEVWLQADKMADYKDYLSVSAQGASLLLSQEMVQYKGDNFEKIIINALLAINFLAQQDLEGAFVETRRLNEKLEFFRIEGKKNYDQNVFARYLGAMIRETNRDWDGAYIDYKKSFELDPGIPYLKEDLVRAAYNSRAMEDFKRYSSEFAIKYKDEWRDKNKGEIVLIFQQGWGPEKRPRPESPRFPRLFPVRSVTQFAQMQVAGGPEETTQPIYSIQEVAIKTLDDDYAFLVAKRMAGIVVKEVAADQIAQKNEALGLLTKIVLHASDRADLRQWSMLPETFQVAKVYVPAGTHRVKIQGLNSRGVPTGEFAEEIEVTVKPRKKTFITWRSFQ